MSKLIAMAGLPGTGKTTLARLLAARLQAVYLNKDDVRAALFAPGDVEYSSQQNDFCMSILYQLAGYHAQQHPTRAIIIDGRTYSRSEQLVPMRECAEHYGLELFVIECVCSTSVAEARIQNDAGKHVAADRSVELYRRVKAQWQEIAGPKLVVETDTLSGEQQLDLILKHLQGK